MGRAETSHITINKTKITIAEIIEIEVILRKLTWIREVKKGNIGPKGKKENKSEARNIESNIRTKRKRKIRNDTENKAIKWNSRITL